MNQLTVDTRASTITILGFKVSFKAQWIKPGIDVQRGEVHGERQAHGKERKEPCW